MQRLTFSTDCSWTCKNAKEAFWYLILMNYRHGSSEMPKKRLKQTHYIFPVLTAFLILNCYRLVLILNLLSHIPFGEILNLCFKMANQAIRNETYCCHCWTILRMPTLKCFALPFIDPLSSKLKTRMRFDNFLSTTLCWWTFLQFTQRSSAEHWKQCLTFGKQCKELL